MTQWIEEGSPRRAVWLVGEAPGQDEVSSRRPFTGQSGRLLDELLNEAGFSRSECFLTNVCHERPPSYQRNGKWIHNDIEQWFATKTAAHAERLDLVAGRYPRAPITDGLAHLQELLAAHSPTLIIAFGNTPLWALAGVTGITKWRGSVLSTSHGHKLLATFHPADVIYTQTHKPIVLQDLRRAKRESAFREVRRPQWEFTVPRTPAEFTAWCAAYCADSEQPLIADTEGWGRVDCIGFAPDATHACCVPFIHPSAEAVEDASAIHYWSTEDEFTLTQACRTVLSSRRMVFHHALWDMQVIGRRWAMLPRLHGDTQVAQHVAFPGLLGGKIDSVTGHVDKKGSSLSLSFIASMYCQHYRFWKDDGRDFDPSVHDEAQLWAYNMEDCVRTAECFNVLCDDGGVIDRLHLREQYEFEMELFEPVLTAMFRGIRYDREGAIRARAELAAARAECKAWLDIAVGCDFNPDSTPQMRALFYDDLQVPQLRNRKTGAPTLDDAALDTIARRTPLLRPLVAQIQNYRTLDTLRASLDPDAVSADGRLRFALNIAFVETFRFSCNESAFGEGGNIQNIKRPDDD